MKSTTKRRIHEWFELYGRHASILAIPELVKDFLFEEPEEDATVHLVILTHKEPIPRFPHRKNDMLIFYYLNKQQIIFRWKGVRCQFNDVEYESYEEIKKMTDEMENGGDSEEDDSGEYGFGGDWWKS
jgi:hypothetical protein